MLYTGVYSAFGLSTAAFHALNVGLHALNAVLLYVFGLRLGFDRRAVLLAALLWALHPLHSEAVTYMSATADPLHMTFLLAGLIAWQGARCRIVWSLLFYALALQAKEAAIVFPALVCTVIFLEQKKIDWRAYLPTVPLWGLACVYLILRATLLDFHHSFSFYDQPNDYTQSIAVRFFTFLSLVPQGVVE